MEDQISYEELKSNEEAGFVNGALLDAERVLHNL